MPLPLHALRFENASAPPLLILHGLLGSSRNWTAAARELAADFDVHAPDLRNHGDSPHAESMRWAELTGDLLRYMDEHGLERAHLIGHSLGGKAAMRLACERPDRVDRIVVVDIAPKDYPPYHKRKFEAMLRIPTAELTSRKEADALLAETVEGWAMRQFLLTNLVRDGERGFRWQLNLEALHDGLPKMRRDSLREDDRFDGPALLVAGGRSDFIADGDAEAMRGRFPRLEVETLPEAGHNVHVDDKEGFLRAVRTFLGVA